MGSVLKFLDELYPQMSWPPIWNSQWQEIKYSLICVISENPFEKVGRIRSSFQMRCTLRSDIPPSFIWSEQLAQLFRWGEPSDQIYPLVSDEVNNSLNFSDEVYPQIRYTTQVSDEVNNSVNFSDEVHTETQSWNEFIFSDEVFMCSCCIGNMTSWILSNLCRLLCVVVVVAAVTVACCCCPAIVLVHVQLQINFQQQQHYIGIIIIKRWIIRKICNNLCRCICMLLLLLYNVLVVHL